MKAYVVRKKDNYKALSFDTNAEAESFFNTMHSLLGSSVLEDYYIERIKDDNEKKKDDKRHFDLEKALRDGKCKTVGGDEVTQLKEYEIIEGQCLVGTIKGRLWTWLKDGCMYTDKDSLNDLTTEPTKSKRYLYVVRDKCTCEIRTTPIYTHSAIFDQTCVEVLQKFEFEVEE